MDRILAKLKQIVLLLGLFCLQSHILNSQSYSSRDNYTGDWLTPTTWNPVWEEPQTDISGYNIIINGYISVNGSLSFRSSASNLIINDTLVIKGNLSLGSNNDMTVADNGIVIVLGNLSFGNQTIVAANGYLIVADSLTKQSSILQGAFTSNDDPVKVFLGEAVSSVLLSVNNANYPVLNCTEPITIPYLNSNCSYGNNTDLQSDPIISFFQNICSATNGNSAISVCERDSIRLFSAVGESHVWSGPSGFSSSLQNPVIPLAGTEMSGAYTIAVTIATGCTDTDIIDVKVNDLPVAVAGPDQELKFIFETYMNAELNPSETGEWSVISGSADFNDYQSPSTRVTGLSRGENRLLWKVRNDSCKSSAELKITVIDPFAPTVITPNGDGKNDYFKISEIPGRVELIIFNRWGIEEYTSKNYLNDWDGRNNNGAELPNDTYFYVLKFENIKTIQGSVLIKR
jgi:gliding motility-associated-like protein